MANATLVVACTLLLVTLGVNGMVASSVPATGTGSAPVTAERLTVRVTAAELAAGQLQPASVSSAATLLNQHGCVLLSGVASTELVGTCQEVVASNYDAYRAALKDKGVKPDEGFAFAEIVHRSQRRYDMQLGDQAAAPLAEAVLENAPWTPLLHKMLGKSAHHLFTGAVVAEPGAGDQGQHMDGGHLWHDTHGWEQPHCPTHCLNVFLPLADIAAEPSLGPTEFWPGSHAVGEARAAYLLTYLPT